MVKKTIKKLAMHKRDIIWGIVLIVVIGATLFGILKYNEYKIGLIQKEEQIQTMLLSHQQSIEELKDEIGFLRLESDDKVDKIRKQLEVEETIRKAIETEREAQELLSQAKISNLEKRLSETSLSVDISSVIKDWEPLVAYITCDFQMGASKLHYGTSGSGVVIKFENSPIGILTNRHVLISPAMYNFNSCSVKLSGSNSEFHVSADDIEISASEYDWGTLFINNPDSSLVSIASTFPNLCAQKPSLGDEIVVLGYPGIGSQNSVTATEGIISGFDGDYFITSAKVEQGNSGGAAILIKDNCFLGIPTFASLGQVESLARILDIWTVVVKK